MRYAQSHVVGRFSSSTMGCGAGESRPVVRQTEHSLDADRRINGGAGTGSRRFRDGILCKPRTAGSDVTDTKSRCAQPIPFVRAVRHTLRVMRTYRCKTLRIPTVNLRSSCPEHPSASYADLERIARHNDCLCCRAFLRAWYHFAECRLAVSEYQEHRRRRLAESAQSTPNTIGLMAGKGR